jgi:transposase
MADKDAKFEALQQQGTLNPRPKQVHDELFLQDDFFDPRDLVQVKYEMLRRVQAEGQSVTDASANFGFSRPSFYQALSAFEQDGLSGLVPHKRGPKQAHKLTHEVLTFIGEVRQKEPSVRLPDLVKQIQERFGIRVHPRSIERSLLRHQKNSADRARWFTARPSRSGCRVRATAPRCHGNGGPSWRRLGLGAFCAKRNDRLDAGLVGMRSLQQTKLTLSA